MKGAGPARARIVAGGSAARALPTREGMRVNGFKVPSAEGLNHDYLFSRPPFTRM